MTRRLAAVCRKVCQHAPRMPDLFRAGVKTWFTKLCAFQGRKGFFGLGNTQGEVVKDSRDRTICRAVSLKGTCRLFPFLERGIVSIPASRLTWFHRNPNCSARLMPVSTANAMNCQ